MDEKQTEILITAEEAQGIYETLDQNCWNNIIPCHCWNDE